MKMITSCMKHLSPTALALSIFAIFLGATWSALIMLDDWLETTGRRTISERLLSLEWDGVLGVITILAIVGAFAFTFCSLGGHLWFYKGDRQYIWVYAYAMWCLAGLAGFWFGHHFFYQEPPK